MMSPDPTSLTATQQILLAAADLVEAGHDPFTEWDLTVAAWHRDRNRFGCRGYEDRYPDHKRVMMEIMARKKTDNPLRRGFMEKVRPNYYTMTPLGRSEASRLQGRDENGQTSTRSPGHVFVAVEPFATHRAFKKWLADPEEPRSWLGAASFLNIARNSPTELHDRQRRAREAVKRAIEWCEETDSDVLTRGSHGGGRITYADLLRLREFLDVLERRFHRQMDAIRRKGQ